MAKTSKIKVKNGGWRCVDRSELRVNSRHCLDVDDVERERERDKDIKREACERTLF